MSEQSLFLSHAGEDKAAFAEPLARELMRLGIRVWLDKWEICPGDSLVGRIFEEGLKNASAVAVVLSQHSVEKPWVKKELSVAVVQQINAQSVLIPIRIDDAPVPHALTDVAWLDLRTESSVERIATRIAHQLHGRSEKPVLGAVPAYMEKRSISIPGMNATDAAVLQILYEAALDTYAPFVQYPHVKEALDAAHISFDVANESVAVLEQHGYVVNRDDTAMQRHLIVELPCTTVMNVAATLKVDVEGVIRKVAAAIVNEGVGTLHNLVDGLGEPKGLLRAIVLYLKYEGHLKADGAGQGNLFIHNVSPSLRRLVS